MRMSAVRVSAQPRTLTLRGERELRGFSQAVVLKEILDFLRERHVLSVHFLFGSDIRVTFNSALDREPVLCNGSLAIKGVRCWFKEDGAPATFVHILYLPFEQSNEVVKLALAQYGEVKSVHMQHYPGHPGIASGSRLISVVLKQDPP